MKAHILHNPKFASPGDDIGAEVSIPVLDCHILPVQVSDQVKNLKPDKASGPEGIPPGIFLLLPMQIFLTMVTLSNIAFMSVQYPLTW